VAIKWKCWVCGWKATSEQGCEPMRACKWCAPRLGPDDVSPPHSAGDVWWHPQYGERHVVEADPLSFMPIGFYQGGVGTTWWDAAFLEARGWRRQPARRLVLVRSMYWTTFNRRT
jgi:hypothetical protein